VKTYDKKNQKKVDLKKIFMAIMSILIITYSLAMVYRLIKNPSKTFLVENGKLYFEENTLRLYNKR